MDVEADEKRIKQSTEDIVYSTYVNVIYTLKNLFDLRVPVNCIEKGSIAVWTHHNLILIFH